jgi:NAD(P)-dependent dehydrogenase (short-subunit alcohol dehydrogenase family)
MNRLTQLIAAGTLAYAGLQVGRTIARRRRRFDWAGRRVIVTGGSRGLGLVLARQLARRGARLAICSRDESDLREAARQLRRCGAEVIAGRCDVRSREEVAAFVGRVADAYQGIDVLFNVAGIITVGPLDAMTMDDFEDSMQTNCWGALRSVLEVLPHMRRQRWGRIVNVAGCAPNSSGRISWSPRLAPD